MFNLLYKEFRLAAHPTLYIFTLMGCLIMIPNYPYCMVFIFGCLAPFITLYNGRENHDAFYTALLPVKKSDVVKAKYLLFIITEFTQMLIALPFAYLRITSNAGQNSVGIEPNVAYLGFGFMIFTIFNALFFSEFYKTAYKVGKAFVLGIIPAVLAVILVEALTHIETFGWIDSTDLDSMYKQLPILLIGIVFFIIGNYIAYIIAKNRFAKVDL